jgi:hypothetical protein
VLTSGYTRSHLENVHRIFDQRPNRSRHRRSSELQQQPDSFKDGIEDSQWAQIENILKVKRDKGKDKSDVEKWFDLWKVLFPNDPAPAHPCEYIVDSISAAGN